jgi:hypothetical protein
MKETAHSAASAKAWPWSSSDEHCSIVGLARQIALVR